nr:hypothetical protein [Komarekiella delphini-convector]
MPDNHWFTFTTLRHTIITPNNSALGQLCARSLKESKVRSRLS